MLDITTNNPTSASNLGYYGYDISADEAAAELLADDDMMDPLFDEDWLHENNLDILFDLFEEEIESKAGVDPAHNGSSALFGTSPVTSYLFGTSPSLASALDLLYFDNQQQPTINNNSTNLTAQQQQQFTNAAAPANGSHISGNLSTSSSSSTTTSANNSNVSSFNQSGNRSINNSTFNVSGAKKSAHRGGGNAQQVGSKGANASSSITNAMRIKRGMKRGQSEGVSLLAKPFSSNSAKAPVADGTGSSGGSSKKDRKSDKTNSSKSDKTSAKITNFKSSIIIGNTSNNSSNRNGIDINYSKQNQQQQQQQQQREKYYVHNCTQHVHYITGRSVMHEHAYAVRGH